MKLIVANFKMNLLKEDILEYVKHFNNELSNVIFCPSNIYLNYFLEKNLNVGSQDVAFEEKGAFTGDVSASQLKSIGVKYTIIGHSERRKYHNDDKYVNSKLIYALNNNLIPILCIGETKEERENNETYEVLKNQLNEAFNNINSDLLSNVIIAYEPIWSIGTGVIPSNEDIYNTITFIKKYLYEQYNFQLKVLYGGSVNNSNISELETINNIDGYLIGGSSIDYNKFLDIINKVNI